MERAEYRPMPAHKAPRAIGYRHPTVFHRVAADSPAIAVMTDLRHVNPATIGREATLAEATRLMFARNVRLLLVVDDEDAVVGLVTARDLYGERPVQRAHDRSANHADLRVGDLMTPTEDIDVLDIRDVLLAEVGHVVASLKAWGRQHALVAEEDPATGTSLICGIFSATQVGRQLGITLQPFDVATTFADIERALVR